MSLEIKIQLFCRASFSPFSAPTLHPAVSMYPSISFCHLETQTQVCSCKLGSGCQMLPAMALQFCADRDTIVSVISIIMEPSMATVRVKFVKRSRAICYPVWKQTDVTMSRHKLTNSAQTHTVRGKPRVCVLLSHTHTHTWVTRFRSGNRIIQELSGQASKCFAGGTDSLMRGSFISTHTVK